MGLGPLSQSRTFRCRSRHVAPQTHEEMCVTLLIYPCDCKIVQKFAASSPRSSGAHPGRGQVALAPMEHTRGEGNLPSIGIEALRLRPETRATCPRLGSKRCGCARSEGNLPSIGIEALQLRAQRPLCKAPSQAAPMLRRQCTISMAAAAASKPLLNSSSAARAAACSIFSTGRISTTTGRR